MMAHPASPPSIPLPPPQSQRYDDCMARYQEAGLKQAASLSALNFGQSCIFTVSMAAGMIMTAQVRVYHDG